MQPFEKLRSIIDGMEKNGCRLENIKISADFVDSPFVDGFPTKKDTGKRLLVVHYSSRSNHHLQKSGRRLKKVKLNGIPIRQICADCKREFTEYRWSPFWCPECDAKRIDRISKSLVGRLPPTKKGSKEI